MNLYAEIGQTFIEQAITEFYLRAFADPMICHFFMGHDRQALTKKQIDFTVGILGGPKKFRGRPLTKVHEVLPIRPPHFGRRQVILSDVLRDLNLNQDLAERWLAREEQLRPLILPTK